MAEADRSSDGEEEAPLPVGGEGVMVGRTLGRGGRDAVIMVGSGLTVGDASGGCCCGWGGGGRTAICVGWCGGGRAANVVEDVDGPSKGWKGLPMISAGVLVVAGSGVTVAVDETLLNKKKA